MGYHDCVPPSGHPADSAKHAANVRGILFMTRGTKIDDTRRMGAASRQHGDAAGRAKRGAGHGDRHPEEGREEGARGQHVHCESSPVCVSALASETGPANHVTAPRADGVRSLRSTITSWTRHQLHCGHSLGTVIQTSATVLQVLPAKSRRCLPMGMPAIFCMWAIILIVRILQCQFAVST